MELALELERVKLRDRQGGQHKSQGPWPTSVMMTESLVCLLPAKGLVCVCKRLAEVL